MDNEEILRKNFNDWLDQGLKQRGWTMRELARRCRTSQPHISNIKNGERSVTWDVVADIAATFGELPEMAFRTVGLLPNHRTDSQDIIDTLAHLSGDQVEEVKRFIKFRRGETSEP